MKAGSFWYCVGERFYVNILGCVSVCLPCISVHMETDYRKRKCSYHPNHELLFVLLSLSSSICISNTITNYSIFLQFEQGHLT